MKISAKSEQGTRKIPVVILTAIDHKLGRN